jgi:hypothetical protein
MTLSGRTKLLVVLFAVAPWLTPAPVSAAFWIVLDRTSGPSGTVVHGRTLGSGSVTLTPSQSLPMFLIEQDLASPIDDSSDQGLIRLGELVVHANGDGTTTFTIPDVDPGRYDVLVHCEPCALSSAGATMLFGAELEVELTPPGTDSELVTTSGVWLLLPLAFAVATLVVLRLDPKRRR